jgi:hypothetical protein
MTSLAKTGVRTHSSIGSTPGPRPELTTHRIPPLHFVAGLLFFSVLALLWRLPALSHLDTHYIGGAELDAGLYVWLTASLSSPLTPLNYDHWFHTPAFYPYGLTLAWSDNYILPGMLVRLGTQYGLSLPLAYNLSLLAALSLAGFFAFVLAYRLTGSLFAAVFGGVFFLCFQGLSGHVGHPQLQWTFFLPAGCILLTSMARCPRFTTALFFGIATTLTFLTSVYYALFLMFLAGVFLSSLFIARRFTLGATLRFAAGAGVGMLPLIAFAPPYATVKATFGPRALHEAYYFAATGLSYVSASSFNWLYRGTAGLSHAEAQWFPGLSALALAFLGVIRPSLGRLHSVTLALMGVLAVTTTMPSLALLSGLLAWGASAMLLAFLLSYGRRVDTERGSAWRVGFSACALASLLSSFGPLDPARHTLSPFTVLYQLPGFDGLRASGRFGIPFVLCLSVLAAFGAVHLLQRFGRRGAVALAVLTGLMVVENYNELLPLEPRSAAPPAVQRLSDYPSGAVAMLPLTSEMKPHREVKSWSNFATLNVRYMLWGLEAGRRVLNGYSGLRSKIMYDYPRALRGFPDRRSVLALQRIGGLRYVVYHSPSDPAFTPERFALLPPELTLLTQDPSGTYLFRLDDTREIRTPVEILVPPPPRSAVEFELSLPPTEGLPSHTLRGEITDGTTTERVSLNVSEDGVWRSYMVKIPDHLNQVRPTRIVLHPLQDRVATVRGITPSVLATTMNDDG